MEFAWILLAVAGLMEPCWVHTLERSEHFRRKGYAIATVVLIVVDLCILSAAMGTIGAGVSYAVWAGIGAVTTFAMGAAIYKDPVSPARVFFVALLIAGVVGLHMTTGGHRWAGPRRDGC